MIRIIETLLRTWAAWMMAVVGTAGLARIILGPPQLELSLVRLFWPESTFHFLLSVSAAAFIPGLLAMLVSYSLPPWGGSSTAHLWRSIKVALFGSGGAAIVCLLIFPPVSLLLLPVVYLPVATLAVFICSWRYVRE
jgi:hypothetical protein